MEQQFYSDLIPQEQYKTQEGIRGKNRRLLKKYQGTPDKSEIEDGLVVNNLPLAYAVSEWWYIHYQDTITRQTIEDLRQDAIEKLIRWIRRGDFSLAPRKFSVELYYRISGVFYQYFKRYESQDALDYSEATTDLDSFRVDYEVAANDRLKDRERLIIDCHIYRGMDMEEIGWRLGLTRERVGQIYLKSLDKILYRKIEIGIGRLKRTELVQTEHYNILKSYLG